MDLILFGILAYFGGGSMGSMLGAASSIAAAKAAEQQQKAYAEYTERMNGKRIN